MIPTLKSSRQRGMTILEVLVALAVFAMVSITLMSAMNNQIYGLERLENKTYASIVADNQLQEILLRNQIPSFSWVTGKETLADKDWYYRYKAEKTVDNQFIAIEMEVHTSKNYDAQVITLRTYIYKK